MRRCSTRWSSRSTWSVRVLLARDTERNGAMIRCVHIWTGDDGASHFEDGRIDLPKGERGDVLSGLSDVVSISFRETHAGGAFEWHDAPARQFVITLSGTLDFQTREGKHFMLRPGDILLAEDTTGSGHSWKLV